MSENDIKRVFNSLIYLRDSKIYSDEGLINLDDGSQGGTHWTYFIIKENKSFFSDSIGGQQDEFLLNQLPKPKIYHKCKIEVFNSKLCGSYCLYFFYLLETMN